MTPFSYNSVPLQKSESQNVLLTDLESRFALKEMKWRRNDGGRQAMLIMEDY